MSSRASLVWFGCLTALFAVHAAFVDHFIAFRDAFGDRPLTGVDYDLHIGQVYRVVDALRGWGKTWLYDVQLLAGQPEGTILDSGSKGWELWSFALVSLGMPRAIAFNTFVLAVMLTAPLWVLLAARAFDFGRWTSLTAAGMASTLWLFDSHLHWVWFVGMISWSGASCLALWVLGLFYRFLAEPTPGRALAVGALAGVCLLIHPYTFFILALPMLVMYARAFRSFTPREHVLIGVIGVLPLALNAYWLHNAATHWHYILDSAFYAQAQPEYALCDFFDVLCNASDSGVIGTRTGFRFLYLGLALSALGLWWRQRDDRLLPLAACIFPLYFIAYMAGYLPGMQQTQPYRQLTPAMLATTLPAAAFVARTLGQLAAASPTLKLWSAALGFALFQQLAATQVLYFLPELVPRPAPHPDGSRSPLSGYGHVSHQDLPDHVRYTVPHDADVMEFGAETLIQWLERNVPAGDRILVEGPLLGERIAWRTRLEVLGGFVERNIQHVDANYFRRFGIGHAATPRELEEYLRTYAVQWVVALRPEFGQVPQLLTRVNFVGGRPIYRSVLPAERLLTGGGRVEASENRLHVRASDPSQPLVLSYHWHEALRCRPNCSVERHPIAIDRVGFIHVPAPHPAELTIFNGY